MTSRLSPVVPVTVVIPCYQSHGCIERALESVAAQTARPAETLLIDDGNDQRFYEVVQAFRERSPDLSLRILKNARNSGPSFSRNRGWDEAQGEAVAFLDHDDTWHPRKLEWQFDRFRQPSPPGLVAHRSVVVADGHHLDQWNGPWQDADIEPTALARSNFFSTPTVMVRRDLTLRFNPRLRYAEDYDLWLRIIFGGQRGIYMDAPLAFIHKPRFGGGGLSGHLLKMEKGVQGVYRRLAEAGSISPAFCRALRFYSALKFVRRCLLVLANRTPQ